MARMKRIEEFPDYAITDDGRVFNLPRHRMLKKIKNQYGYWKVNLYRDGKMFTRGIHTLVARAFVPNPKNLEAVNHKNEVKTDNRVDNLEWMTRADNNRYGTAIERRAKSKSRPVLQYDLSGNFIRRFDSQATAAKAAGISKANLCSLLKGKRNSAGGYKWENERR